MKTFHYWLRQIKDTRGTVIVYVAVVIVVLLGFVALAVDIGYVMVSRNEIQNVADASALAATRRLGVIYESMSYQNQQLYDLSDYPTDLSAIRQAALDVAARNIAAQQNIVLNINDIIIGRWHPEWTPPDIEPRLDRPDAVRVIARRSDSPLSQGPITTFFAKIFGAYTFNVSGIGTAALTGQSTAGPGGLPVPMGISRYWFTNNSCNQPIRFYPTNDPTSCAGWHVFDRYTNMNDRDLRTTIGELENGMYQSPLVTAGQTEFSFGGGTMSTQTFAAFESLFLARRGMNDGVIDSDNDPLTWTAGVPVYDWGDCSNPNTMVPIVGFATIVITGVQSAPVHQVDGYVICNNIEPGRGGGGPYGTLGSIPGLVQ